MIVQRYPAVLYTVTADNGDPLLLYGVDTVGSVMLWPTPYIERHRLGFARFCRRHISELAGHRIVMHHPLCERTERWARWLGVRFEAGIARL